MSGQGETSAATKWTVRLGLGGVTFIAAVASYLHALGVVQAADGRTLVAAFIPAVADLLIAAASANILDATRQGADVPKLSVFGIGVAVVVTLGLNIAAGHPHEVPSWLVNVWPPVAFMLALESFMGHVRRGRAGDVAQPVPAAPPPLHAAAGDGQPPRELLDAWIRELCESESQNRVADLVGVSRPRVAAAIAAAAGPQPDPNLSSMNGASA